MLAHLLLGFLLVLTDATLPAPRAPSVPRPGRDRVESRDQLSQLKQSLEPNGPLSRLTRSLGPAPAWAQEAETERTPRKLRPHEQKRAKLALNQKMSKVPVFLVTNENGAPFLNELPSGDYSALMFLFPAEAKKMLDNVLKAPNGASSGARLTPTNLHRAFNLAQQPPTSSGQLNRVTNRERTMKLQFKGPDNQGQAAKLLPAKLGKRAPSVPVYYVDGLVVKHGGRNVHPLFLSKDDCNTAVAKLEGERPEVTEHDLMATLVNLAEGVDQGNAETAKEIAQIELIPPSESVALQSKVEGEKQKRPARIFRR